MILTILILLGIGLAVYTCFLHSIGPILDVYKRQVLFPRIDMEKELAELEAAAAPKEEPQEESVPACLLYTAGIAGHAPVPAGGKRNRADLGAVRQAAALKLLLEEPPEEGTQPLQNLSLIHI